MSFRLWDHIGRFRINFSSTWRKLQFQHSCVFHFSSNRISLEDLFAKVSPQQMVLPDHSIKMVLVQAVHCLCKELHVLLDGEVSLVEVPTFRPTFLGNLMSGLPVSWFFCTSHPVCMFVTDIWQYC